MKDTITTAAEAGYSFMHNPSELVVSYALIGQAAGWDTYSSEVTHGEDGPGTGLWAVHVSKVSEVGVGRRLVIVDGETYIAVYTREDGSDDVVIDNHEDLLKIILT
jgi:hypothetical protein